MYQVGEAAIWTLGRLGQAGHVTEGSVNTGKRSIADLYETERAIAIIPEGFRSIICAVGRTTTPPLRDCLRRYSDPGLYRLLKNSDFD